MNIACPFLLSFFPSFLQQVFSHDFSGAIFFPTLTTDREPFLLLFFHSFLEREIEKKNIGDGRGKKIDKVPPKVNLLCSLYCAVAAAAHFFLFIITIYLCEEEVEREREKEKEKKTNILFWG